MADNVTVHIGQGSTLQLTAAELEERCAGSAMDVPDGDEGHGARNVAVELVYRVVSPSGVTPTAFEVCAGDGFYAAIPWALASESTLQFSGTPTDPSNPPTIRLWVKDSPNACLNVKSIVDIDFQIDRELTAPTFGSKLPGNPKVCKTQD